MSIPTPHISATKKEQIAKTVLMPGDPLRAKFIAEKYLSDVKLFNETRGMLGFTGTYKGKQVSVMGSGMGIPSSMIYYTELFKFYDVENIIRIGTAGSIQKHIHLRDLVVATAAASESSINKKTFGEVNFSPTPDFELLLKAHEISKEMNLTTHFSQVLSSDQFYADEDKVLFDNLVRYGIACLEMESYGLYTVARKLNKKALALFTISDSLVNDEQDSAESRQTAYTNMMELALEVAIRS